MEIHLQAMNCWNLIQKCKAGRFVGLADCYAALVLADNSTFLLAVNRMVAFCKKIRKPTT